MLNFLSEILLFSLTHLEKGHILNKHLFYHKELSIF